jgi:hypothetical protein
MINFRVGGEAVGALRRNLAVAYGEGEGDGEAVKLAAICDGALGASGWA